MDVPEKRQGEAKIARRSKRKAVAPKPKPAAFPDPSRRDDKLDCRALIVGINDYLGTVNDLPSCVNDARAVDELVRGAYKFASTKVLVDADATIANVTAELERLFSKPTADTRLLFYYSGHGSTERKGSTLEECLCLYDGSFFDDRLVQLAAAAPPGVFTAIFNSCFSGGMDKQLLKTAIGPEGNIERGRVKAFLREDPAGVPGPRQGPGGREVRQTVFRPAVRSTDHGRQRDPVWRDARKGADAGPAFRRSRSETAQRAPAFRLP